MANKIGKIVIASGRERSIQKFHPWVFSGALKEGEAERGELVDLVDAEDQFLARAYFNDHATIACRILTWNDKEEIDEGFFSQRLFAALQRRKPFLSQTNAFRLIFSEADAIPGLVIDIYDKVAVIQISTLGLEAFRGVIVQALIRTIDLVAVYEHSDSDSREMEGLKPRIGLLWGELPTEKLEIFEGPAKFYVDVVEGQKTGFFLDQRANRMAIANFVKGKKVLNTFSYTGGFSIHAALAGATSVTSVDSSATAIAMAKENASLNKVSDKCLFACEDVFEYLKKTDEQFDVIILDPPGLVKSKKDLQAGTNAYRVLYQLALKRLVPDGLLITASCSGWVDRPLFHKIAFWACEKQGINLRLIEERGHTWDHPISVFFPEGEYLKFAIYQREF